MGGIIALEGGAGWRASGECAERLAGLKSSAYIERLGALALRQGALGFFFDEGMFEAHSGQA
jgi:hypothetical protein